MRLRFGLVVTVAMIVASASAAEAAPFPDEILLPGAGSAEGITMGLDTTFYAGELETGDVFRGDLLSGEVHPFVDVEADDRMAVGMDVDSGGRLLFVAGGATGQGYVYDAATGAEVAVYQLTDPAGGTFVNDVTVTADAAWFTDSAQPQLYRVPLDPAGTLGPADTLALLGPAADVSSQFNLNGIAATPDGSELLVAHSGNGTIIVVDPSDGTSRTVAGVSVPSADGILYEAGHLWVVQNFLNQIVRVDLTPDLASGTVEDVITSPLFQIPTTVARYGSRLAAVNAKFDDPDADEHEVVIVDARLELSTTLTGSREVSPTGALGAGDLDSYGGAAVTVHGDEVCFELQVVGAVDLPAIAAHIHEGVIGENGPVVVPLDAPGVDRRSEGCVEDVDVAIELARHPERFYVNVHTDQFPAGALRGNLRFEADDGTLLATTMNGEREVAPDGSLDAGDLDGFGVATVSITEELCYTLRTRNIGPEPTMAHIHQGPIGENGPIVVTLTPPVDGLRSGGCVADVPADLLADLAANPQNYYVNVHTPDFPGGAVRGNLDLAVSGASTTGVVEAAAP